MEVQRKEKIIKIYKAYNVVDWIIAITIIGIPFVIGALEGLGMPGASVNELMYFVSSLPTTVLTLFVIISMLYTFLCAVLYVKVWSIKEISKGFQYWLDWFLTFALTAYELFIFYVLIFG